MRPRVTVVTPTRPDREKLLRERCFPSLKLQTFQGFDHVIVVDNDYDLAERLRAEGRNAVYLSDLWRTQARSAGEGAWGAFIGILMAAGDIVAFLADDDEYLPEHLELHLAALEQSGADFSLSKEDFYVDGEYVFTIGDGTVRIGSVDANTIVAKRECYRIANYRASSTGTSDFEVVWRWMQAGLKGVWLDETTCIHHDGWLAQRPDIVAAAKRGEDWRAVSKPPTLPMVVSRTIS